MKSIRITAVLLVLLFLFPLYSSAQIENNDIDISANTAEELKTKIYDYVFYKLDNFSTIFSVTITGSVLNSYTYKELLEVRTPFEGDLIDEYMQTPQKDYNALNLRQYTISKTVWNNASNTAVPVKLRIEYQIKWGETKEQADYVTNFASLHANELVKNETGHYKRIKAIHDFIVSTYRYDTTPETRTGGSVHTAYDMINYNKGVCSAYSGLLYKMLTAAGYEARIVINEASALDMFGASQNHAWNMVNINGVWYHIDSTWDDPVSSDGENHPNLKYFLVSDEQISKDHNWNRNLYPICDNNYKVTPLDSAGIPEPRIIDAYIPVNEAIPVGIADAKGADETPSLMDNLSYLKIPTEVDDLINSSIKFNVTKYTKSLDFWIFLIGCIALLRLIYAAAALKRLEVRSKRQAP